MNVRCDGCGLVNLPSVASCRRCGGRLPVAGGPSAVVDHGVLLGEPVLSFDPRRARLYADARNWLLFAAVAILFPWLLLVGMAIATPTEWGSGSTAATFVALGLAGLLVSGAILCGKGKRVGQWVAAPALMVLALLFPVGTLFAIRVSRVVSYAFED